MKKFYFAAMFLLLILAASAFAQSSNLQGLVELYKSMSNYRGPVGRNIIQGTGGRTVIPASPPGKRLFQGVFRSNESGRALAKNFDFYIGNLFTSNYYELQETYVFGIESNDSQPDSSIYPSPRILNEEALAANATAAMPRAASMMRHWVLEKYYVNTFPNSNLALAFQRWGMADSADEQSYASRFFNLYLSSMTSDLQYVPAYILLRQSPVGDSDKSPSLQRARNLVADYPNGRDTALGRIRNAVHNQLSPSVIGMIDAYKRENGSLPSALVEVRKILLSFFSFSPSKSAVIAKRLGLKNLELAANTLAEDEKRDRVSSIESLLEFSNEAAALKSSLATIPFNQKTDAVLLLSYASQFLNSRLTNDKWYSSTTLASKGAVKTVLNTIYIEGLLIKRNYEYFVGKVENASSVDDLKTYLGQATKIGTDTLIKSVSPALDQWKAIEPRMEGFIDNSIKSSSLNTASVVLTRIRN